MKWYILGVMTFFLFVLSTTTVLADGPCELNVSLLNQDPIPAVPGEELEVVFMMSGIDTRNCGTIEFEILEKFPFSVLEGYNSVYTVESGTYTNNFKTYKTIPVKFRVDKNAIDGENPLEVRSRASKNLGGYLIETFDIDVEDVRADFEVFVSDYDYQSQEITFEVLNIGDNDVEAVTVQVLDSDGVSIIGSDRENIGDLSSNEDTSSEFTLGVTGEVIHLRISYSDAINVRRTIEKEVEFNGAYFESTKVVEENNSWQWIVGLVVVVFILYLWRKRKAKKK